MKKFYCLYNKNNLPFFWKLKKANDKPLANFKTREDCLNYYLSLNNEGIIWFQKSSTKNVSAENIRDTFDGYIKSIFVDDILVHKIETVPSLSSNASRIMKRNLHHSLQIDPVTGKDLLIDKNVDRLYNNKNSYLIFDNDVAEEVMTFGDLQPRKTSENYVKQNNSDLDKNNFSSPELLREQLQVPESKVYFSHDQNKTSEIKNTNTNNFENEYQTIQDFNPSETDQFGEDFSFPYDDSQLSYSNNQGNFGVQTSDFNFLNDFENSRLEMNPINEQDFFNNIFQNYFNNNDKIFKNNFYKINRNWESDNIMNNNRRNQNYNPYNDQNNWGTVPIQPGFQRPAYGTVEFTAVPNQMLNTELNPLGGETMIFNPYSMQRDTIIQPVIQPVIQNLYQPPIAQTIILEPIINNPISSNPQSDGGYYNNYSQNYSSPQQPQQQQYVTSEFQFDNHDKSYGGNYSPTQQQRMQQPTQQQRMQQPTQQQRMQQPTQQQRMQQPTKQQRMQQPTQQQRLQQPTSERTGTNFVPAKIEKKSKKTLYFLIVLAVILLLGIGTILTLMFGFPGLVFPVVPV
ncbi:MAG: hypothetical protein KFW07_02750 [Mycoplasmataceae bacterium]|nr:hypothetical protein [Mycoplasmataceae bacterium]